MCDTIAVLGIRMIIGALALTLVLTRGYRAAENSAYSAAAGVGFFTAPMPFTDLSLFCSFLKIR